MRGSSAPLPHSVGKLQENGNALATAIAVSDKTALYLQVKSLVSSTTSMKLAANLFICKWGRISNSLQFW